MSVLIKNIQQLIQVRNDKQVLKGAAMNDLPIIENAFIFCDKGIIQQFGAMADLQNANINAAETIDATGCVVGPGWVDSHTHLVFAATRESEFVDRINGLSYAEIAQRGGGILNSAKKLQAESAEKLFESAWQRLMEVIAMGTVAIEIKSGYGLSVESELKMLRVIKRLKEKSPIPVKATLLAAHAYPIEFRENHRGYLDLIKNELLPIVAKENLADYFDVFCEEGFFSVAETDELLQAAQQYNLIPKIHANQLNHSGGVEVGVKNNALSVDHLECVGEAEIKCLQTANTLPVLLPAAAFFLQLPYQPAKKIMEAGLPVVLASDYNPGSCPSGNMNFVMSLACTQMHMTPAQAINACTINAAHALQLEEKLGTIAVGKIANLFITQPISSYAVLPYSFGKNVIAQMILNGKKFVAN